MNQLASILTDLGADPSLREQLRTDPKGLLTARGLTESEQAAILSGCRDEISAMVASGMTAVTCNSFFADPGPDPDTDPEPWPDEGSKGSE